MADNSELRCPLCTDNSDRHSKSLWITDGTKENTKLIKDHIDNFYSMNEKVYFVSWKEQEDSVHELWVSDPAKENIEVVVSYDYPPNYLTIVDTVDNQLYFNIFNTGTGNSSFWVTNRAKGNAELVIENNLGVYDPIETIGVNLYILTTASDLSRQVYAINRVYRNSKLISTFPSGSFVNLITVVGDELIFTPRDPLGENPTIWTTDGENTHAIYKNEFNFRNGFGVLADKLFFLSNDEIHGEE